MVTHLLFLFQSVLLSAIAATGFAMVFNVPAKHLKYCAMLGALGHGSRTLMVQLGLSIEWGSLAAAFLVGFFALVISSKQLIYPKIISIAAIIPMFPGVSAYKAAIALIKLGHNGYTTELMSQLVSNFLQAAFVAGALALGLTLPGVWMFRRKMRI